MKIDGILVLLTAYSIFVCVFLAFGFYIELEMGTQKQKLDANRNCSDCCREIRQ